MSRQIAIILCRLPLSIVVFYLLIVVKCKHFIHLASTGFYFAAYQVASDACRLPNGRTGHVDIWGACIMLAIASRRIKDFATFAVEYHFLDVFGLASRQAVTSAEAKEIWPALKKRAIRVYSAGQYPAEQGDLCAFCPRQPECWPEIETNFDDLDDLFE